MKTNLTIIFIFFLLSCGGDKSTGVAVIKIDYIAEHQLFIENLLELNPELNSDTLETRIKKEIVVSDGTEYYQISKINLKFVFENKMLSSNTLNIKKTEKNPKTSQLFGKF